MIRPPSAQAGRAICGLAMIALCAALAHGQSQTPANSATLQGIVLDSRGHPVVAAVHLQTVGETEGTQQSLTAQTDANGRYQFSGLRVGSYVVRAELAGSGEARFGPFVLGENETKQIDLRLEPAKSAAQQSASAAPQGAIKFFDEPNFTVAGVTDAAPPGGHGGDTIMRSTEALAKDTVSLTHESPGHAQPVPPSASAPTDDSLRQAAEREPGNFEPNVQLGKLLADEGKPRDAIVYLERASKLNPGDYASSYELALAYEAAGDYEKARTSAQALLQRNDLSLTSERQAELHHLLGDIEEKSGNPVEAARDYQRAAALGPSERNIFDWGAELLLHRAPDPAIEVFLMGHQSFPRSVRMLVGLGVAQYARGSYGEAAERLCEASDLDSADPNPYLFLGRMLSVVTIQSDCVVRKLKQFAELQPENAEANYYYAVSLWQRRTEPEDGRRSAEVEVESLLQKAIRLDPQLGGGYLQLGVLYSERGDFPKAIAALQQAIAATPRSEEAHYRLAQAYRRTGETVKAQQELQLYEQIKKETTAEAERQRREIQQFIFTLRDAASATPP